MAKTPGSAKDQPRDENGRFLQRYPDPEKRRELWLKFLDHLAQGHGVYSFPGFSGQTAYWLASEYTECRPDEMKEALRQGLLRLEKIAMDCAEKGTGTGHVALALARNKAAFMGIREWRADDDIAASDKRQHEEKLLSKRIAGAVGEGDVEVPAGTVEIKLRIIKPDGEGNGD